MARLIRANDENIKEKLKQQLEGYFPENSRIAVKLHMGEPGNKHYVKADFVKKVIDVLKELKLRPFLFESLVTYEGGRHSVEKSLASAKRHGFTEESIGCPIVISDKFVAENVEGIDVEVCKDFIEADGMLILSHVKGHFCCGFGGAIKNLGMGCVTKKSKRDIHNVAIPVLSGDCNGCKTCEPACIFKAIKVVDGKAAIDESSCYGCSQCVIACPQNALKPKGEVFDTALAKGAAAVVRRMQPKKAFYVNVLKNISKFCDCASAGGGPIIAKDVGLLLGEDPVAIDKASVDLINKQAGYDLFKKIHHHDPYLQIRTAARLGIGKEEYELSD